MDHEGELHVPGWAHGAERRKYIEDAIPNRLDSQHGCSRVTVTYRTSGGDHVTRVGDSLGVAEQPTGTVDRHSLILRTGALPLLMIPLSTIVYIGDAGGER